jgi:uncharacterized protein involved in outer membrane biogenesis
MRWSIRWFRLAIIAAVLLVVYALVGFFLVPHIIKAYVIPSVAEKLHRPVSVADVEVNPFLLSVRLTGFDIREVDQSPVIGFEEFYINLQAISLFHRAYVFDTIRLTLPYISVKVSKEGRLNLLDLLPPAEEPQEPAPPQAEKAPSPIPAVEIGQFEIAQGVVEFRDDSKPRPYELVIVPIRIALKNFFTRPGGENTYAFTAELGRGETLAWEGTIALEPIRSSGKFVLSGLNLPDLWKYVQDRFRFTITDGMLTADAAYTIDAGADPPLVQVARANTQIETLKITEEGGLDPVIVIPTVKVEDVDFDLAKRDITVANIAVEQASWTAWLNPDGTVNYQQLFAPVTPSQSAAPPPSASAPRKEEKPWSVLLKQITLKDHAINFEDRSLATPARIKIAALTAETSDVHIPLRGPLPLSVAMQINETGQIHVKGSVVPNPFQVDLTLGLKDIAIMPFQSYLEKFARIDVLSGAVNVDGDLHLAVQHPRGPFLSYEGNANVAELAVADRDQGNEVASMKRFSLNTIRLTVDPTSLSIREVGLQEPVVHLVIQSDGGLNLAKLKSSEPSVAPAEQKPPPAEKSKSAPVPVTIGTVKLLKAAATFRDETVQPPVDTGISDFTGTIKGLSSKQVARADVDLAGRVDRVAPLKIVGTINPLSEDAFTDLAITFQNLDLTAEGPYSRKYVGYELSKGKLSFDLKYKVSQKSLEAENKVLVDQLTFGEKTNSPDATSIPVPFVVALLQDRQGRIEIDLPIRGDLNDPDFKYGRVLLSTLGNILMKVAASPFSLLGKLVPGGGSGEELQFFEFEPGSTSLAATELKKAEALIKALQERPGLRLEITGTADPVLDRQALRLQKLKTQLKTKWQQERALPKDADFPADEEERMIKERFEQEHVQPTGAVPAPKPDVATKPPTVEEMRQQLAASIPVDDASLRSLADERAKQMRGQLAGEGKLADERVFLTEVNVTASGYEKIRSRLNITAGS